MINEAQFNEFTDALKTGGLGGNITNHPTCLVVGDLGGSELVSVLGLLPSGLKPDEILTQNPPKTGRSWSQFILVFWKEVPTKGRGRPVGGTVGNPGKETGSTDAAIKE